MKLFTICSALALGLSMASPASATLWRDEGLQRLWDHGRMDEFQRELAGRTGPEALAAQAMIGSDATDEATLDKALAQAEACVAQHPQVAVCHYALGSVLGTQAMTGGMFKALRLVGRVRESFTRAVQLDPMLFEARLALQQSYLIAPAVAGGSVDKARALEAPVREAQPELAKLMRAHLAAKEERWDEMERELLAIKYSDSVSFQNEVMGGWNVLTRHWLKSQQSSKALERLEQLSKLLPTLAMPAYLKGRVAAAAGQHAEAMRLFERCRDLVGAARLPIDYRIGVSLMELGEKDKARALLQRYAGGKRLNPVNLEDAQRRLKALG